MAPRPSAGSASPPSRASPRLAAEQGVEALKWFRRAADQDIPEAQFNVGLMYAKGQGVPRDNLQAHVWFDLAAAHGHDQALKGLGIAARLLAPDEIAEAERLARGWRPQKVFLQSIDP